MDQDLLMWNAIVAALLPMGIALVQQPSWPSWARATVTLLICVVGGVVTSLLTDEWNPEDVVTSVLTIFAAVLAFHTAFFKPTGITDAIERATSPGTPPAPIDHTTPPAPPSPHTH